MDVQKSIQKLEKRQQIATKKLAGANQDDREVVFRKSMSDDKWLNALTKANINVA